MNDTTVTVKLTGRRYRALVRELEYHAQQIKENTPDRHLSAQPFKKRLLEVQDLLEALQ